MSEPTVRKYRDMEDLSERPPAAAEPGFPSLEGLTGTIDSWLEDDCRNWRKQRHTATRVYVRLREELGYDGSYSTVQLHEGEAVIRNYVAGAGVEFAEVSGELLPFMLHGTGDLYASSLLAAVMCGKDVLTSVEFASEFVRDAMRITSAQPDFELRGVSFESELGKVAALLR